jgi:hypothetical protein
MSAAGWLGRMSSAGNVQGLSALGRGTGGAAEDGPNTARPSRGSPPPAPGHGDGCHAAAVGRRLRTLAAPPGSAMTTPPGHGRSRRRRWRAWRPPGGRGASTSTKTQSTEHDRLQLVNYRTGRPIPHRHAGPRHRMPLGRHYQLHQASAAEAGFVQHVVSGQRRRATVGQPIRCCSVALAGWVRSEAGLRLVNGLVASRATSASDSTRS